ncbi:NAD(P)H oxidoreductase RTN4IP1, mitochondrial-like isoform X1 [Rhodnius prolixus]
MDEVTFHVGQKVEVLQVWMYETTQKLYQLTEELIMKALASHQAQSVRIVVKGSADKVLEALKELIDKFSIVVDPQYVCGYLSRVIGHDMNRSTLYACCFGFTVGSSLGLVIGICLQTPRQPNVLMKAIAATAFTGIDSITLLEDAFVPKLYKPTQLLIEVKCATLDPIDVKISCGLARTLRGIVNIYNYNCQSELPLILGREGAGIVVEIGSKVKDFEIGDQVYFVTDPWSSGTLAEYVVLDTKDVAKMPSGIVFEVAASFPYSATLAWTAVVVEAKLSNRNAHTKRILIHCASTGCGWFLVQLCAAFGANVTVTCTNKLKGTMKALGASTVLLLESGDVDKHLSHNNRFDIVFNTVGPLATEFCSSACTEDGRIINALPQKLHSDSFGFFLGSLYSMWIRFTHGLFGIELWRSNRENGVILNEITKMIDKKLLQPFVDRVYLPEEIDRALQDIEESNVVGRTVLSFDMRHRKAREFLNPKS